LGGDFAAPLLIGDRLGIGGPNPYTGLVNTATLIAGAGRSLVAALAAESAKRGNETALALIPDSRPDSGGLPSGVHGPLDWNPPSPISAGALILAAENRVGPLDCAVLACSAPERAAASDFSPAGIDFIVNNHIKSYMLLAASLVRRFRSRQSGTLALVLLEEQEAGLLAAPVFSAFRAFANCLLAQSGEGGPRTAAFDCGSRTPADLTEIAGYVFRTLDGNRPSGTGRWFKFNRFLNSLIQ
jgi:NAD(P)-dependent dehydrogenase (short-subunit alcohol dehydrogenase family)